METPDYDTTEMDIRMLSHLFQLIAERGRRIRLSKQATTVNAEPLAGDKLTVVDPPPAKTADTF